MIEDRRKSKTGKNFLNFFDLRYSLHNRHLHLKLNNGKVKQVVRYVRK